MCSPVAPSIVQSLPNEKFDLSKEDDFLRLIDIHKEKIFSIDFRPFKDSHSICYAINNHYVKATALLLELVKNLDSEQFEIQCGSIFPLHLLCEDLMNPQCLEEKIEILKLLLNTGSRWFHVDKENEQGETPLTTLFNQIDKYKLESGTQSHYWHFVYILVMQGGDLFARSNKSFARLDELLRDYLDNPQIMQRCPLTTKQQKDLRTLSLGFKGRYSTQDILGLSKRIVRLIDSICWICENTLLRSDLYASYSDKDHASLPQAIAEKDEKIAKVKTSLKELKIAWMQHGKQKRLIDCFNSRTSYLSDQSCVISYFLKGPYYRIPTDHPDLPLCDVTPDEDAINILSLEKTGATAKISEGPWSPRGMLEKLKEK